MRFPKLTGWRGGLVVAAGVAGVLAFTHFALTMHPVEARVTDWPRQASERLTAWFTPDEAIGAAVPAPVRTLLRAYR